MPKSAEKSPGHFKLFKPNSARRELLPGGPRDCPGVHPTTAALVVEISDTTLQTDLKEKAERYATAHVADDWVLDLNARQLRVLRDPQPLPKGLGATA